MYVESALFVKEGMTLAAAGPATTVIAYKPIMSQGNILTCGNGASIRGFWLVGAPDCVIAGFREATFGLQNCVIWGNASVLGGYYGQRRAIFTNCTVFGNEEGIVSKDGSSATLHNTIVWGNNSNLVGDVSASHCNIEGGWPGEGNIDADPVFADPRQADANLLLNVPYVDPVIADLRLKPGSPCIDAGNDKPAHFLKRDIAGNPRILYGGRSSTVDVGAYEFYINKVEPVPDTDEATFTWSSLADATYAIFTSDDLFTWHLAIDNFPSAGNQTTFWTDDGTLTGLPPSLVPRRFYRLLENP